MPAGNNTNILSSQKTRNASQSKMKVLLGSGPKEDGITEAFVSSSRFIAGQVALYFELWKNLTSDPCVGHYSILG